MVGENNDGINTDFESLKETCKFFETINNSFKDINDQPLLEFLKNQKDNYIWMQTIPVWKIFLRIFIVPMKNHQILR